VELWKKLSPVERESSEWNDNWGRWVRITEPHEPPEFDRYPRRIRWTTVEIPIPEPVSDPDPVNNPTHYKGKGGLQVLDIINAFDLGFYDGNVVKYLCRAGKKDPAKEIEDMEKALFYLTRFIELRKAELETNKK
jgi:hypothetical protein